MTKKRNKKTVGKKLDIVWSEAIKVRAGYKCEHCGKTTNLNSHHIFTRLRKSTRWELDNGICLCVGCHMFSSKFSAHKTGVEFTHWLEEKKGKKWVETLQRMSNEIYRPTLEEMEETLTYLEKYVNNAK